MAAADVLTFDIVPPRRPSLEDVGGAALKDDAKNPPIPPEMPYAAQLNQWALLIQRIGGLIPVAIIDVRFVAGTPVIDSFTCAPTAPLTGTFTLTDNGNGDTTITWPANTFPTPILKPDAGITEDVAALAPIALNVANGVRVKTRNNSNVLTDIAFKVLVY